MRCSFPYNEPTRKGCPESRKNPKLLASDAPWQLLAHQADDCVSRLPVSMCTMGIARLSKLSKPNAASVI